MKRKVLVAEDMPDLLNQYVEILESLGWVALGATSGPAAYELFLKHADDIPLVITDSQMPEQGGLWLARQIRQRGTAIRIILISGDLKSSTSKEAISLFDEILLKPVSRNALEEALKCPLN